MRGVPLSRPVVLLKAAHEGRLTIEKVRSSPFESLADGEIFKQAAGIDVVHVPYSGTGPLSTALVAGQVEVGIMSLVNVRQHVAAGKLRLVAIMEEKR